MNNKKVFLVFVICLFLVGSVSAANGLGKKDLYNKKRGNLLW